MSVDPNHDGLCIFCEIIAGRSPGNIRHDDDDIVVFDNKLDWVPLMLLITPRRHLTQSQVWTDPELLSRMGSLAVQLGNELAPAGFRLITNFGHDALQTQRHAHLHLVGGRKLGLYVERDTRATAELGRPR